MAEGRRRDEWDRHAELMCLIFNRTEFGKDAKPLKPRDFWPPALLTEDEKNPTQPIPRVTVSQMIDRFLGPAK